MLSPVDTIKERLSIVDVVGQYLKLDKAGTNFKAKCPFHNEKTPSFFVSPDRGSYYCFGCGAKGDIFTFIQEFEGLDFKGALKVLAERAGVNLSEFKKEGDDEKSFLYKALELSSYFFSKNLLPQSEAYAYLVKRGLTDETIKEWKIGFVSDTWRSLHTFLSSQGITDVIAEKAGLIKRSDEAVYDRFRGRIMFPISDSSGRVIAFTGRILHDDGKSGKYVNSPETILFYKSKTLYGLDKAKFSIRRQDYSILVEGQMDLIMCHQAGFTNTVASSGTALTQEHLEVLHRLSNRIVMAFDADKAGFNAATRAWPLALALGMEVKIAELPKGFDPADLILKDKTRFVEVLKNTKHIIDFFLSRMVSEYADIRARAVAIRNEVLPYVAAVPSTVERSYFIKKLEGATGIPEVAWWEDLKKIPSPLVAQAIPRTSAGIPERSLVSKGSVERQIIGILFWKNKTSSPAGNDGGIRATVHTEVLEILGKDTLENIQKEAESIREELIFEAEMHYATEGLVEKELPLLLHRLKEDTLKRKLSEQMGLLREAEKNKDTPQATEIFRRCNELSKQLNNLKKLSS